MGNYTIVAKGSTSGFSAQTSIHIRPLINLYSVRSGEVGGQSNPGGQIRVSGGGFNANEQVNIYFQTKKNGITTVITDSTGSFDTTITVPVHYSSGTTYYVYAKNVAGKASARANFTYITPSATFSYRYSPDPSAGILYISGFATNEKLLIVDRYQQSNQVHIQTLTADANGSATAKITWPSSPHADQMPFAVLGETTKLIATGTHFLEPTLLTTTTDEIDAVGSAGDIIQFNGKNFVAVEKVNITFSGKVLSTTTSGKDGSFVASVVVPPLENVSSGQGDVQVRAVGVTSGLVGGANPYFVTFYYQPTLTLTPTSGPSGTTITVTGTHFPANATIPIGWDGPFTPNPDLSEYPVGIYAVTNFNQNGSFTTTVQANNLVSGQTYHVTASNYPGGPTLLTTATFVAQ